MDNKIDKIHKFLLDNKLTIALAESCTAGLIANNLVKKPGASGYLKLGLVVYSVEAKIKLCNSDGTTKSAIDNYGVISEQLSVALANNVKSILDDDIGLGITGLAGPGGDANYPEGTAFVTINKHGVIHSKKIENNGNRVENIEYFTEKALDFLHSVLFSTQIDCF